MVLYTKGSPARRALVWVSVSALLLACIFLQTHIFWSTGELGTKEQEEFGVSGEHPNFTFVIKLLTYDRLHSLIRCLDSLAAADYGTQVVKLHVFIDHFPLNTTPSSSPSSKSPFPSALVVEKELQESHALLTYVDRFTWLHGPKEIHYRTQNAGLQGQWLEAWWPASDHEFSFVVEDDMHLSPLYFKYLRSIIETYYYKPSNYDPTVYGISLQRPRFVPGKHGNKLRLDEATHLFLYQLVGTWGQLLFPRPWKEFRLWYDVHKSRNSKPILDGMVTTGWYLRSGERIWTPWFIKFAHCKGYYNLYTHFSNEQALSVSYRDKGVNTKKEAGPDSTLIEDENVLGLNLREMKPVDQLKRYDFCFHEVKQSRLIENTQDAEAIIGSFQENGTIILVNALGFCEDIIRNWLCQFSKFGIRNFAILIEDHGIKKYLLRTGHAVIRLDPESLKKELYGTSQDNSVYAQRGIAIIQAVAMVLQVGYNVWLTDVGTLWLANPFPLVHIGNADMLGFAAGRQVSSELLYIKGSKRTASFWRNLHKNALQQADIFASSMNSSYKQDYLRPLIGNLMLEEVLGFKFLSPTLKVDFATAYGNRSGGPFRSTAALLVGIPRDNSYAHVLKPFGLWKLDEELVCTCVYC